MNSIMDKYLLPAGYEFQKVQSDLQRLASGKELFDQGALRALTECGNNNERVELLERYLSYVLPNQDGVLNEYPEILAALGNAFIAAETADIVPLETPFGTMSGRAGSHVADAAANILDQLRYVDVKATLQFLLRMFAASKTDASRQRWVKSAESLASFDIDLWDRAGPTVQLMVADALSELDESSIVAVRPIAIAMLRCVLSTEISGSRMSSFNSFTISRGTVPPSEQLSRARSLAIDLLERLLHLAKSREERREVTSAVMQGTRWDGGGRVLPGLIAAVLSDAQRIVGILSAHIKDYELDLAEHLEHGLLWLYRHSSELLPAEFANDREVSAAAQRLHDEILRFRDELNADPVFVDYKTLVGYESVFPPAWSNSKFEIEGREEFRRQLIGDLVERVTEDSAWFDFLERCASAPSGDSATFPSMREFMELLARSKPDIVIGYLERVEGNLAESIPVMLLGLAVSARAERVPQLLEAWLRDRRHLERMTRYARFASSLDLDLLQRLVEASIGSENISAVRNLAALAIERHDDAPGLTQVILMPSMTFLRSKDHLRWLSDIWLWARKSTFYRDLDSNQVDAILECVLSLQQVDDGTERLLAAIATDSPSKVIDVLEQLVKKDAERGLDQHRLFPYRMTDLATPLAGSVGLLLAKARALYHADGSLFPYRGGRLIVSIFPHSSGELDAELSRLVAGGDRSSVAFVLSLLRAFSGGEDFAISLCKQIVDVLPEGDVLLGTVELVIDSTGTVSGEFGMVRAFQGKRALVETWLDDPSPSVSAFAAQYVRNADQRIAAEQRRSEESLAIRKLDFDSRHSADDADS
jgi:hypothetical protein